MRKDGGAYEMNQVGGRAPTLVGVPSIDPLSLAIEEFTSLEHWRQDVTEQVDYVKVLADLERRRDEINQVIVTIRGLAGMATDSAAGSIGQPGAANGSGTLKPHMFFGMSAPDAARAYLAAVKEPRTAAKIADGLERHGWTTTSKDPSNIVRTALTRLAEDGEVVQVKDKEWGLIAWFPGLNKGKRVGGVTLEKVTEAKPKPKAKRPRSQYLVFLSEKMSEGMSMKQAAAAWQSQKPKGLLA